MNKEYGPFERTRQNNFSYWFPKVESCGIRVPQSLIVPVPSNIVSAFFMDNPEADAAVINAFVDEAVSPALRSTGFGNNYFVKNGTFSDKYNAASGCLPGPHQRLADVIASINYQSACVDAGGHSEIVIRERIGYDRAKTPCIYNGLPLRPEFRVFYDFDDRKVMFSVNYWDYDYIRRNNGDHLHDMTDKIIFDHEADKLARIYEERKQEVETLVAEAMSNVAGLENAWSIDILLDERGTFWLIDMAVAERSAYWEWRNGKVVHERPKAAERHESAIEAFLQDLAVVEDI